MKGVSNRKLADLIATYQIPVPFSFIHFRDVVVQFSQRVPQFLQEKADVLTVTSPCFKCGQHGHVANDSTQQPTCYRCNRLGHISTKCRMKDVFCSVCKSSRHVTEACRRQTTTKTTAATAGSANGTQEEVTGADVFNVSQKMTGSAFATAMVSTSASGSDNFSQQIKILVDTGNLLSIGECV